jgi:L-alanine-DL-glutamate epimerase-like enolase superfamily enzyme
VGEDPRDMHRLFRKLQLATSGSGSVAGIVYNAISGIEAALWDVFGQWLDVPIYRLLGGKFRDRVRIYADCHGGEALESLDEVLRSRAASWESKNRQHVAKDYFGEAGEEAPSSPDDYRRQALKKRAEGFTALKFDLDVPGTQGFDPHNRTLNNRAIDHMVSLIAAVHEAVGNDTDIAVDCHWRYNASDVVKVAHELEPFRLLWLEDPVPPNNTAALKEVNAKVQVPIATGENLFLFEGFPGNHCATRAQRRYSRSAKGRRFVDRPNHCAIRRRAHDAGGSAQYQQSGRHSSRGSLSAPRSQTFLRLSFTPPKFLSGMI